MVTDATVRSVDHRRRAHLVTATALAAVAVTIATSWHGTADMQQRDRLRSLLSDVQAYDHQIGEHPGAASACLEARTRYDTEAAAVDGWPWAELPRRIDPADPATDCRP